MGEIIGVLANPSETLRALTESKRMLEETRRELSESRERAQLSPTHTFSPLPNFYDRPNELKAIERALGSEFSFTVLFGASSVGKTALLRQVLTNNKKYHVLHFDLRIAGFADLASLYMSLSQQMETFFKEVSRDPDLPGYEEFEREAWAFKHDRLNVERRYNVDGSGGSALGEIKTSDVARLMELFQSSLLKYWKFEPNQAESPRSPSRRNSRPTNGDAVHTRDDRSIKSISRLKFWSRRSRGEKKQIQNDDREIRRQSANEKPKKPTVNPAKKTPVLFIDEAHKLPALIKSMDAMKCLLDAMLVLTKQDRLCHVIHATSDPFYQTWLRQLNVMQHCKIITIGDYPKLDTRRYYRDRVLESVPPELRGGLDFEKLYDAFGGKLAHWQDFVDDYKAANGKLDIKQSSHFLQAHALLNLHVIHSAQSPPPDSDEKERGQNPQPPDHQAANNSNNPPLSPGSGFRIYSPLAAVAGDPHNSPPSYSSSNSPAEFTAIQLLKVMNRLAQPGKRALSYFLLCREMGARAVDGMIRGRILDLRWTDPVSKEGWDPRALSMRVARESIAPNRAAASSGTMVNDPNAPPMSDIGDRPETYVDPEEEMVALSEEEIMRDNQRAWEMHGLEEEDEIVGPKVVPITPIMRFAMREVVQEYYDDDDRTASEYASLSAVDEY